MTEEEGGPQGLSDGGSGLLRQDFFQICHVTNDIDRAKALYRETLGIGNFQSMEGELPEGGHARIALAWAGGVMHELATAHGPGAGAFMEVLPAGGDFAIRFHHFGYLIRDDGAWQALDGQIARCGAAIRLRTHIPGFMKFMIVQVPLLGHFVEYVFPEAQGMAMLENVPRN